VLVMVTVDDESNCLDGASPAQAAALLTEWGAGRRRRELLHRAHHGADRHRGHARGHHAAAGRHAQRRHAARRRGPQHLSLLAGVHGQLCAQGHPAGVQIVGGCCGTTPNHIRAMRSAMRAMDAQARVEVTGAAPALSKETPPAPLGPQRSRIGALVAEGSSSPWSRSFRPSGIDCSKEIEGAQLLARSASTPSTCPTRRAPRRA
jgi:methionine synthase / methylenetetrahydrofolate reductase(NADPH)